MNVGDLIEALESFDPETEVRIAFQPSWPLRANVAAVTDLTGPDAGDSPAAASDCDEDGQYVWLAATDGVANENPYAPQAAWTGAEQ